jgi:hypothetical protein
MMLFACTYCRSAELQCGPQETLRDMHLNAKSRQSLVSRLFLREIRSDIQVNGIKTHVKLV